MGRVSFQGLGRGSDSPSLPTAGVGMALPEWRLCSAGPGAARGPTDPQEQKHHYWCEPHLVARAAAPTAGPTQACPTPEDEPQTRTAWGAGQSGGLSRNEQFPEHAAEVQVRTHVASAAGPQPPREPARTGQPEPRQGAASPGAPGRNPQPHAQGGGRQSRRVHTFSHTRGQKRQEESTGPSGGKEGRSELAVRTVGAACLLPLAAPPRPQLLGVPAPADGTATCTVSPPSPSPRGEASPGAPPPHPAARPLTATPREAACLLTGT